MSNYDKANKDFSRFMAFTGIFGAVLLILKAIPFIVIQYKILFR